MRLHGWEERLLAVVEAESARPFDWSDGACVRFPARVVEALTGVAPDLPVMTDAKSAKRALKRLKAATLADAFGQLFEEIPVAMAQRGDIGVVSRDGVEGGVVCTGRDWRGSSFDGLLIVHGSAVQRAFRV